MANDPIDITPEDSVVSIYLVELSEEEVAEQAAAVAQIEEDAAVAAAALDAATVAKESAKAKLAALGLTEEEVAALLN